MNVGARPTLGLIPILRKLYRAGINVSVEADRDGSFTVSISKKRHRLAAIKHFAANELHLIAEWLEREARELYPVEYA